MMTGQNLYLGMVVLAFVVLMGALGFVSIWSSRKP